MPRRLLPLAAAAVLLTSAAVAVAATPKVGTFVAPKGKIQRGYDLQFKVDKKGKRITKLVAHVLETCSGSSTSTTTTVGPGLSWTVKDGRFKARKKESSGGLTLYTTLEGRFTNATTAVGTIRQESIVAGAVCDTYKLKFTAKRR
ncbi:hypothetical protein [Paraconexibacter sp.]|uniref:hypothetical protein n=1 Tax=Paraconexibacter sp. TaxID=2949640 RepID=UPI0035623572